MNQEDSMAKYEHQDHYHQKAKKEGKVCRATYKIEEMQAKYRLFRPGNRVIDLGCAPGGWIMPISEWIGEKGRIVGIDLDPVDIGLPDNAQCLVGNIEDYIDTPEKFTDPLGGFAHAVVSDMAPHTSGTKFQDQARSADLVWMALECSQAVLAPGGHFVAKIFDGPDVQNIRKEMMQIFEKTRCFTPKSSRKGSMERYLVGTGRK